MRPIIITLAPVIDPNGVALSQTTGGAGNLIINGVFATDGVATLPAAQQITLTSAGNISGVDFTITGKDQDGRAQAVTITGPNATTVQTTIYFTEISQIAVDGAVASAVEVGSADDTISATLPVNWREHNFAMGLFIELSSGAVLDYTVQHTPDDIQTSSTADVFWSDTVELINLTASDEGNIVVPVCAVRLKFNSFTSGTAKLTVKQGGN